VSPTGPSAPIGSDYDDGGPLSQRNPPGYTKRPDMLRYENVAFLSTPTPSGMHSIVIDDPRAATQKAVGIGDPLAAVRKAYPGIRCQPHHDRGEYAPDPAHCSGRLTPERYIWFGGIRSASSRSRPRRWSRPPDPTCAKPPRAVTKRPRFVTEANRGLTPAQVRGWIVAAA